jgi:hypothetical protein
VTNDVQKYEIKRYIYFIRGYEVMLDSDIAQIYGVETKIINRTVRRNIERFPNEDFIFQLSEHEFRSLKPSEDQFVSGRGKHRKYLPYVFTEYGATMLSFLLCEGKVDPAQIAIIRAFVEYRRVAETISTLSSKIQQLGEIQRKNEERQHLQLMAVQNSIQELTQLVGKSSASKILLPEKDTRPNWQQRIGGGNFSEGIVSNHHTVEIIQNEVAEYFRISKKDLNGQSRKRDFSIPRQIAFFLIRKHLGLAYGEIGKVFGGRDHTTILHAVRKVEQSMLKDGSTKVAVETIKSKILL